MTFWTSSEHYKDIRKQLRIPSLLIETEVNKRIDSLSLNLKAAQWAVIYMIAPEQYLCAFPEVVRFASRRTVLEFRLIVDYESFKQSTELVRTKMLLDCLRRSIDLMSQLNVNNSDREQLHKLIDEVEINIDLKP